MTRVLIIKANGKIVDRVFKPWEEVTEYHRDMILASELEEGDKAIIGTQVYIKRGRSLWPLKVK